jgi:hypothetical protein
MTVRVFPLAALLVLCFGPYGLLPHGLAHACGAAKSGDHCAPCRVLAHAGAETPARPVDLVLHSWVPVLSLPADPVPEPDDVPSLGPRAPPFAFPRN